MLNPQTLAQILAAGGALLLLLGLVALCAGATRPARPQPPIRVDVCIRECAHCQPATATLPAPAYAGADPWAPTVQLPVLRPRRGGRHAARPERRNLTPGVAAFAHHG